MFDDENPTVIHPTTFAMLKDIRRLLTSDGTGMQQIEVSDAHVVASHDDCPALAMAVSETLPILVPIKVIPNDVLIARFAKWTVQRLGVSTDSPRVIVPTNCPTLVESRWLPRRARPTKHRIDVSESQAEP